VTWKTTTNYLGTMGLANNAVISSSQGLNTVGLQQTYSLNIVDGIFVSTGAAVRINNPKIDGGSLTAANGHVITINAAYWSGGSLASAGTGVVKFIGNDNIDCSWQYYYRHGSNCQW
jgi:hypothetical protein